MKAVYALVLFLATSYAFADENSSSNESSEEVEVEQSRWWWWRPKCPPGRVWRQVRCVPTCSTMNLPCRPGLWESKCVCRKRLVENSEGKCVLPWSKKCRNESTEPPTTTTEATTVSEDTTTEQPTDLPTDAPTVIPTNVSPIDVTIPV